MKNFSLSLVAAAAVLALSSLAPAHAAVDADGAQALLKSNGCTKCHAVDKTKKGPSWQKVAAELKGKPDAQAKVIKAFMTGPKVKFEDGSEETHKILDSKDTKEQQNLADWILAQ